MAIATRLKRYLDDRATKYDVLSHPPAPSASRTAEASHVSGDRLAKGVVLRKGGEYLLAVLPASRHLVLEEIERWLGRPVELATEAEIGPLFPDCEVGAVPAIGSAYGVDLAVDDSLEQATEVYFEGGDHATLIRVTTEDFRRLTADAPRMRFSVHD